LVPNHFWLQADSNKIIAEGTMFSIRGASDYVLPQERFVLSRLRVLTID